jgi:hypothetical protein
VKLIPGGEENTITLHRKKVVRGSARDSSTGQPLEKFLVMPAAGNAASLSTYSSSSETEFSKGTFEIELSESAQNVVRIRASGYLPKIYEIPASSDQQIEAILEPAQGLSGAVVDMNGSRVPQAEVAVSTRDHRNATLAERHLSADAEAGAFTIANEQGEFAMQPAAEVKWVFAASPAGFGAISLEELLHSKTIVVRPWSRISGVWLEQNAGVPGKDIILVRGGQEAGALRLGAPFKSKTDASGKFAFDWAPPGEVRLAEIVPMDMGLAGASGAVGKVFVFTNYMNLRLEPGQWTNVVYSPSSAR